MDLAGAGRSSPLLGLPIVVLANSKDRAPGFGRRGDRRDPIVSPGGQVDDRPVNVGERRRECGGRPNRHGLGTGGPDEIGQPGRPDQVVGQDRDSPGQPRVSARW